MLDDNCFEDHSLNVQYGKSNVWVKLNPTAEKCEKEDFTHLSLDDMIINDSIARINATIPNIKKIDWVKMDDEERTLALIQNGFIKYKSDGKHKMTGTLEIFNNPMDIKIDIEDDNDNNDYIKNKITGAYKK